MQSDMKPLWLKAPIRGLLLDITGVLYESGEGIGTVIEGSVEAILRLKKAGCPFRLVTNETSKNTESLLAELAHHGYQFEAKDVFSPIPAMKSILKRNNQSPHLLVHPDVESDFDEFIKNSPSCVVMGDADENFTFANLNKTFNVLMSMESPILYSMGRGKYFRHNNKLQLDVGSFAAAIEFACDLKAIIIGKPSPDYFQAALDDLNLSAHEVVMVGDDVNSDVGGAQSLGLRGVLVKTGKFTPQIAAASKFTPDFTADNLSHAVDTILEVQKFG